MFKFGNWEIWFMAIVGVTLVSALPIYDDDYDSGDNDYDVIFDQRQNGTENVRVAVDGVVIALPAPPSQSGISSLAGSAFIEMLSSQLASLENEGSDEDSYDHSTTSTTSTTTSTTTLAPSYQQDPFIPANLFGQGLSFLFKKGAEIPIKIASELKPLRTGKPALMVVKKHEDEDDDEELNDPESAEPVENVPKKVSKHKRRYKLKMANMLKPLLQRTYVI